MMKMLECWKMQDRNDPIRKFLYYAQFNSGHLTSFITEKRIYC